MQAWVFQVVYPYTYELRELMCGPAEKNLSKEMLKARDAIIQMVMDMSGRCMA